ncbi:MAG TPA: TRAP transporter large permease subunit [Clostridia bacterium]|nr:TRAP transporter large permease subunit [Clostridia bacterium]
MFVALALFLTTYALLLAFPRHRAYIAMAAAALFVLLGILPYRKVFFAINWNVILMIAGTMGTVSLFIASKMPSLLADLIIARMPSVKWAIISLALFAGIISAFVDNVATVLMVAPVALTICEKLGISPVTSIIAIAISSNLQGAATLVGDTTSILLGGCAGMDFLDFFVYRGRPGLFWVVQFGAIVSALVLLWVFRKEGQSIDVKDRTEVENYFPTALLLGTILLLILASFIPEEKKPEITNGLICTGLMLIGVIYETLRSRSLEPLKRTLAEIDYFTLLLLSGIFIMVAGITEAGVVNAISELFVRVSGNNLFLMYTLIVWASVLASAFIDNIPYVATMLPVTQGIAGLMGVDPTILYFGLLVGATLGGNLTPIGASANITGIGILRSRGYEVSTGQFMKISVPFTLAAVTSGYVLVWFIWA